MTAAQLFQIVSMGSLLLPIGVTVAVLVGLPGPRHLAAKAISAVLLAWTASILYTALIYNPAGIASAIEQGVDSPAMKYDNNTIASKLLGGWLLPTVIVGIFFLGRSIWHGRRRVKSNV